MRVATLILALCLSLISTLTFGFRPHSYSKNKSFSNKQMPIGDRVLRPAISNSPQLLMPLGKQMIQVKLDAISKAPRVLTGNFDIQLDPALAKPSDFIETCRHFISEYPGYFDTKIDDLVLVSQATLINPSEQFIKFKVKRNDIVIQDSNIDCRFKFGKLVQAINQSYSEAEELEEYGASSSNKVQLFNPKFVHKSNTELIYRVVVNPANDGYQLVKIEQMDIEDADGNHLKAQTDANSGRLLELKDTRHYATLRAQSQVYPRWYGEESQMMPSAYLQVQTGLSFVTTDHAGETLDFNAGNEAPLVDTLKGPFVGVSTKTRTKTTKIREKASEQDGTWLVDIKRSEDTAPSIDMRTAQIMAFYHVNRIKDMARKYIQSPWLEKKLIANTNISDYCNANFDTYEGSINFYRANNECANTANIADVIYHEFGHGLDWNTGGIDDGAFSEGYGDILSLIFSGDSKLGIGFFLADGSPVRDLAIAKRYPQDTGEVHDEGQIIGSTFYDLYLALLSKYGSHEVVSDKVANYAFKMIFTARTYLDVYDAMLVIDDDDADLENGTPNYCIINKVFADHGLTRVADTCTVVNIDHFDFHTARGDQILLPGDQASMDVWVKNLSFKSLNGLNAKVSVASGSDFITVINPDLEWGSIARKQVAQSMKPVALAVADSAQCGSKFSLNFEFKTGITDVSRSKEFYLGAQEGAPQQAFASGLPAEVKDFSTTEAKINLQNEGWSTNALVKHLELKFDIRHTYVGDLVIFLVDPAGKSVEVFAGSGPSRDVHFNRDVTDLFVESPAVGEWKLQVKDKRVRDEGFLDSFELNVVPVTFSCP